MRAEAAAVVGSLVFLAIKGERLCSLSGKGLVLELPWCILLNSPPPCEPHSECCSVPCV